MQRRAVARIWSRATPPRWRRSSRARATPRSSRAYAKSSARGCEIRSRLFRAAQRPIEAVAAGAERVQHREPADDAQVLHEVDHLGLRLGLVEPPEAVEDERRRDQIEDQAERAEPAEETTCQRESA